MAIEIKFRVAQDTELFDDPISVVNRAAYLSQQLGGIPMTMERGVKYTRSQEFKWTSLGKIEFPMPSAEGSAVMEETDSRAQLSAQDFVARMYKP